MRTLLLNPVFNAGLMATLLNGGSVWLRGQGDTPKHVLISPTLHDLASGDLVLCSRGEYGPYITQVIRVVGSDVLIRSHDATMPGNETEWIVRDRIYGKIIR